MRIKKVRDAVMRLDHDDYIGRVWKKFEDTYGNYIYDH